MGLEAVEFIMTVEDCFGLHIPDEEAGQMQTVGDLYAFLLQEMRQRPAAAEPDVVWDALCELINLELGSAKESIRPETRFVEDLGL